MIATAKSATSSAVKNEKRPAEAPVNDEGEYDEWARGLVNRPIPQVGAQLTLSGVLATSSGIDGVLPPHQGFDLDSAIGRFTWFTLPNTDKHVPCIFREGESYCCVRMFESSILGDLQYALPQDIYEAAKLDTSNVSTAEAKLLSYISSWHCDGLYGIDGFTTQDLVVTVSEMERFYQYLQFAYDVLSSGGGNKSEDYSKCGFVRVNNESLIPYTNLSDTEKGVPLFYFEGQTDILKAKATPLKGWELAYLKICCRVQGVRKDLISAPSLLIVKLTDLKGYFPKRTVFTDKCWPPPKSKSLISKQMLSHRASITNAAKNNSVNSINHSQSSPWLTPSDNLKVTNGRSNSVLNRVVPQPAHSSSVTNNAPGSILNSHARNMSAFNNYNGSGTPQAYTNGYHNQQPRNGITSAVNLQVPRNQIVTGKSLNLSKLKVNTPPVSMVGLTTLPEYPDGVREGAYSIRMIIIENDVVHCINTKPHKQEGHLLILQEFITKFFRGVTIYPTVVSVLKSLGIGTYLPNNGQIRVFNNSGFAINRNWEVPLIPAKEAVQKMTQIRSLLTPKPTVTSRLTSDIEHAGGKTVCIELE